MQVYKGQTYFVVIEKKIKMYIDVKYKNPKIKY